MTGTSYNGTIPVAAATTGVEGLEAIIPVSPEHLLLPLLPLERPGAQPGRLPRRGHGRPLLVHRQRRPRRAAPGATRNVRDEELVPARTGAPATTTTSGRGRDFMQRLDGIQAATFLAHGLNDWNVMPEHSIRVYEALRKRGVPSALYLHRGGHGGPPPLDLMNRWFTRWLYGVENGIENGPARLDRAGGRPIASSPSRIADYPAAGGRARSRSTPRRAACRPAASTAARPAARAGDAGRQLLLLGRHARAGRVDGPPPALRHARAGRRRCASAARRA